MEVPNDQERRRGSVVHQTMLHQSKKLKYRLSVDNIWEIEGFADAYNSSISSNDTSKDDDSLDYEIQHMQVSFDMSCLI